MFASSAILSSAFRIERSQRRNRKGALRYARCSGRSRVYAVHIACLLRSERRRVRAKRVRRNGGSKETTSNFAVALRNFPAPAQLTNPPVDRIAFWYTLRDLVRAPGSTTDGQTEKGRPRPRRRAAIHPGESSSPSCTLCTPPARTPEPF